MPTLTCHLEALLAAKEERAVTKTSQPLSEETRKELASLAKHTPPLNGVLTHPLSVFAMSSLKNIAAAPVPSQEINPGTVNRLLRGALVEVVDAPSPYKSHKGRSIEHLRITEAGRAAISAKATGAAS